MEFSWNWNSLWGAGLNTVWNDRVLRLFTQLSTKLYSHKISAYRSTTIHFVLRNRRYFKEASHFNFATHLHGRPTCISSNAESVWYEFLWLWLVLSRSGFCSTDHFHGNGPTRVFLFWSEAGKFNICNKTAKKNCEYCHSSLWNYQKKLKRLKFFRNFKDGWRRRTFTIRNRVPYNKQLTNRACSGRTGEFWPSRSISKWLIRHHLHLIVMLSSNRHPQAATMPELEPHDFQAKCKTGWCCATIIWARTKC